MLEETRILDRVSTTSVPVLLLKMRSSPTDGYQEYFFGLEDSPYLPEFVPVLEHRLKEDSLSELLDLAQSGAFGVRPPEAAVPHYGGIIFTSQRAVDAFTAVVQQLRRTSLLLQVLLPASLPLYVVGPATARALKALELDCPIVGDESGNGEVLANFILQHYSRNARSNAGTDGTNLPVLFLVGEQRRDIIPKILQSGSLEPSERIAVHELVVYKSNEMRNFHSDFLAAWSKCRRSPYSWIVIFSPTGCKAVLEGLGMLDKASGRIQEDIGHLQRPFVATIGPTTRDFLVREFGFHPEVCARKPNPEGLGEGITTFMQSKTLDDV